MRDTQAPGRSAVMSTNGMVATSQPMATQAGLDILRQGGNAMDAAIAAGATQCVTEPQSTGIGGDCFVLYHEARTGKLHGFNGSGRAPAGATLDIYRKLGLDQIPHRGMLSVTVPGAIDAWDQALNRFGTMGLGEVLQPAIDFAEEGYAVSPVVAQVWQTNAADLAQFEDSRRALLVDGAAPRAGTIHRQPDLARSLRLIAKEGRRAFYTGAIAEEIVRFSQDNGGLLSLEDMAAHRGEWVAPISSEYRGVRLYEMPPNGQGIAALMTLNILEGFEPARMQHLGPDYLHTVIEAFKLALAERDRFVSDPAFSELPIGELLSKDFAARQRARIDPAIALSHPVVSGLPDHRDTIYLSVVDRDRNACSFINSLFWTFGSAAVAGKTGITLQNRGVGFNLEAGHLNCIAPGKRPMHTIIPAMAYRGDGEILCYGVMGGQYQALGHAYVLSNWIDYGMDLQEAIDAPRFLPYQGAVTLERGVPAESRAALVDRGHVLAEAQVPLGGGQAILIDQKAGVLKAASDPRKDGCALGY